ncbi:caprin-2-like [Haliotis cracherodii]|uniref:caprin-2-like n=1 Tax=Haliotis cracherodii TaxID=6455 RepID=UPI0039ED510D
MFVGVLFLCILLSGPLSSLILPMTKPDGSADLTSLLNHVTLLEQTVASLQTDVQTNTVQAAEVASLKTELRLSLNDLAMVKAELNDIKQGNSNTNSQMKVELQSTMALAQSTSKQLERLEKDMNATSAGLHMIQKNLSMMSTEVTTLGSDLSQVQNQSLDNKQLLTVLASKTRNVAFHVYYPLDSPLGTPVTFSHTNYNAGSGYNTTTGKFTAPVSGTFVFWTQLELGETNTNMYVYIMKSGGVNLAAGYVKTDADIDDGDASAITVTHLDKGEEVWVDIYVSEHIYQTPASYFGGVLLSAD